jgi:hypothetical protein
VRLMSGPHVVFDFFNLSKIGSTSKIQNWLNFKISQFLHAALLGYYEQFSQLCGHPIPNINRAKNPRSDSIFEYLMNFKRRLNLPEKSGKFSKKKFLTLYL